MSLANLTLQGVAISAVAALNGAEARQNKRIVEDNANAWAAYTNSLEQEIDRLRATHRAEVEDLNRQLGEMQDRDAHWKAFAQSLRTNLIQVESALRRQSADAAGLEAMYAHLVEEIRALGGTPNLSALDIAERERIFQERWMEFTCSNSFTHQIGPQTLPTTLPRKREAYQPSLSNTLIS